MAADITIDPFTVIEIPTTTVTTLGLKLVSTSIIDVHPSGGGGGGGDGGGGGSERPSSGMIYPRGDS